MRIFRARSIQKTAEARSAETAIVTRRGGQGRPSHSLRLKCVREKEGDVERLLQVQTRIAVCLEGKFMSTEAIFQSRYYAVPSFSPDILP